MYPLRVFKMLFVLETTGKSTAIATQTTLSLAVTFFEEFSKVIKVKENLYLIEQLALDYYAANPKSSASMRNVNLIQNTQLICNGTAPPPPSSPPSSLCDDVEPAFILDVIVQLFLQTTISLKAPVTEELNKFSEAIARCSYPNMASSSNAYTNIQMLVVEFFDVFGISITSGVGLEVYSGIESASIAKNQSALYPLLEKAIEECVGLPLRCDTTKASPESTTSRSDLCATLSPLALAVTFFDEYAKVAQIEENLYLLQQQALDYRAANPRASAGFRNINLIQNTKAFCKGTALKPPSTPPPSLCDGTQIALITDVMIQLIFQSTISTKANVTVALNNFCYEIVPNRGDPNVPNSSDQYENLRVLMVHFFGFFGVSTKSGVGLEIYSGIENACSVKNQTLLYLFLRKAVEECTGIPFVMPTTELADTTTEAQFNEQFTHREFFAGCEQFIDILLSLCVDIRVQWHLENMIVAYLSENPTCTTEEKAMFLTECVRMIKLDMCLPLPEVPPLGFPESSLWSEFLVQYTLEYLYFRNEAVIQATNNCLDLGGVLPLNSSSQFDSKWPEIMKIYEHMSSSFEFASYKSQVVIDMKKTLNFPKYSDEEKLNASPQLLQEILSYCLKYDAYASMTTPVTFAVPRSQRANLCVAKIYMHCV